MERSMTMPFDKGSITATLIVDGQITECEDFGLSMDDLFKKVAHDVLTPTIPSLNHLDRKVETTDGETAASVSLGFELLGTELTLIVSAVLGFVVDEDLVRTQLAMTAMPGVPAKAIELITEYNLRILGRSDRVTPKPSGIADFLNGLGGLDGVEVVGIRG